MRMILWMFSMTSWRKKLKKNKKDEGKEYLVFNKELLAPFYNDYNFFSPIRKSYPQRPISLEEKRRRSQKMLDWWDRMTFVERVALCIRKQKALRERSTRKEKNYYWRRFLVETGRHPKPQWGEHVKRGQDVRSILVQVEHVRKNNYIGVLENKEFMSTW
jgi:hypothetical protein